MCNRQRILQIGFASICLILWGLLLAGCGPDDPTQDVLPTPTTSPMVTPAIDEFTYETITESVLGISTTDKTVHETRSLGLLSADYFAMPPYREIDQVHTMTYFADDQGILAAEIPDNHAFFGVYGMTDEGMVWSEPKYYYGKFSILDTEFQYLVGYVDVGGRLHNALYAENYAHNAFPTYWSYAEDGSGPEVTLSTYRTEDDGRTYYYPVVLNVTTGIMGDFLREINPAVADECAARSFELVRRIDNKIVFYTGRYGTEQKYYYLDLDKEKLVELPEVPAEARRALPMYRYCHVISSWGDVVLLAVDKVGHSSGYRQYFLCDANRGRIVVLEDVVGEELNGCSMLGDKIICAGESNYWSVNVSTLATEKLFETKQVVLGFAESHKSNASFAVIGGQGNYQVYDFAKGTISDLDQLGRWDNLDSASYAVSPDGRKMVIYSKAQGGCIQFAILDCDTNSFVDLVREGGSGMTEETRIWWYTNSAVAVAPDDRQTVNVYTIK